MDDPSRALRKRMLIQCLRNKDEKDEPCLGARTGMSGAYWHIKDTRSTHLRGNKLGDSTELAVNFLARVRTDLDGFSEAEQVDLPASVDRGWHGSAWIRSDRHDRSRR